MTQLILIRHGETDKNVNKNIHGANDPETLNEAGKEQIQQTAKALIKFSSIKIYSSREKRALESAEILSRSLNIPLEAIDGVQERDWGIYSGRPWAEVKAVLDTMSLDERFNYVPPQGESWREMENRLADVIKKITEDNKEGSVIVVTHAGAIRALIPFLLGISRDESFKYDPDNASLTVFDFDQNGFHQVLINDTSHL